MAESARKKQRLSPGIAATPDATAHTEPVTPFRRAISAGPTPGSRKTPTFRTPGTAARTPRGGPATRPISARRVAPTTPHAIRALRERANAARTPGNNRRRSGRVQRETPRDLLRNLSRALARDSHPVEPEPQTLPRRSRHSALDLPDVADSPDVLPRLSMPLEDMYDDDSFHERPPRQSLLPDLPDDVDGATVQSLEFGRRALSEDPRYGRRVSERFADFSELGGVNEEFEIDGTFINRRRTGAFDPLLDQTIVEEEEDTVQALTGRRDGPSSDADLGVFGRDDEEEPTFRFHIPDRIRAPVEEEVLEEAELDEAELDETTALPDIVGDESDIAGDEPDIAEGEPDIAGEDVEVEDEVDDPNTVGITGWESDPEDDELAAYREEESALDRSLDLPEATDSVQKRMGRRKELKLSRVGLDYPSFPAAPVKKLALSFIKSQGGKAQLNKDALAALVQTTDDFFEQIGIDLAAYAQHAGRRSIEESDVLALMRRTRKTSSNTTSFSLAQKMLPRELLQQLRMESQPKLKGQGQKRKRLATVQEEG
ncbi:centromere kinetochore component CENP-T-domain-containing protein [Boeremia exigua]|uniref:centromere kinetochore component CENP-T-domain-containing protein n=1 Tax=Boeremia exigua TaxID=749465 RepID=UPI001E8E7F53|nr:centromere kinetochore component CENP-T-domain-containing protein [Boeremia exigua]KAH6619937.1 centromere kinetochore component CENP-T-domain-containing protein [Boeremia exigua]